MLPKVIHQFWTPHPAPPHIREMMQTWTEHHPDWGYVLWHEHNIGPLVNQDLWDQAELISPAAPEQFRSDVARYEILYNQGGVWVDADFVCQRPLDDLMGEPFAGRVGSVINNALIGITPEHPLMAELVERLPLNVKRRMPAEGNTVKSGPQFFTPIARKHGLKVYPARYFYPYRWDELHRETESFPDAYAIHRWNNRRRAWKP